MAGVITNDAQLIKAMNDGAMKALEGITDEIIDIFQNEYIMKIVYESHVPNSRYHADSRIPTYEFKNAWQWSEIRNEITKLSTELFYDGNKLTFDEESYLHGSIYSNPNDVRMTLMDILNKKGRSSSLWLSSTANRKKAYWDEFIKDMFDKGKLEKIITRHFLANGFTK